MWRKQINDRMYDLEQKIMKVCTHKCVVQRSKGWDYYRCEACGRDFKYIEIPKGSIICKYECKENK
jgi:hypothetical protein